LPRGFQTSGIHSSLTCCVTLLSETGSNIPTVNPRYQDLIIELELDTDFASTETLDNDSADDDADADADYKPDPDIHNQTIDKMVVIEASFMLAPLRADALLRCLDPRPMLT